VQSLKIKSNVTRVGFSNVWLNLFIFSSYLIFFMHVRRFYEIEYQDVVTATSKQAVRKCQLCLLLQYPLICSASLIKACPCFEVRNRFLQQATRP